MSWIGAAVGFLAGMLAMGMGPGSSLAAISHVGSSGSNANRIQARANAHQPAQAPPAQYAFQTIDNPADKTFNQLLGINDQYRIAGYYGIGTPATTHPNKGYQIAWPYTHSDYTNENYPGSQQTQVTGLNNADYTVGFYADAAGNNFGFTDLHGFFRKVVDPRTPKVAPVGGRRSATGGRKLLHQHSHHHVSQRRDPRPVDLSGGSHCPSLK